MLYIFIWILIYILFLYTWYRYQRELKVYLDSWVFLALAHQLVDLKTLLTMSWRSQISIRLVGFEYGKGHLCIVLKMVDTLSSGHLTVVKMMITQMEWDSQFLAFFFSWNRGTWEQRTLVVTLVPPRYVTDSAEFPDQVWGGVAWCYIWWPCYRSSGFKHLSVWRCLK